MTFVRIAGFFIIYAVGLSVHYAPHLALGVVGGGLYFLVAALVSRWARTGSLADLGLRIHHGWGTHLLIGFGLGAVAETLWFLLVWQAGAFTVTGVVASPEFWGRLAYMALNTAYIGCWEELLCRGYLLRVLPPALSRRNLLLLMGLIFMLFHIPRLSPYWVDWVGWFLMGIAFTIPVLATGSLWYSIGLHWSIDLVWFLLKHPDGVLIKGESTAWAWYTDYLGLVMNVGFILAGIYLGRKLGRGQTRAAAA